MEGGGGASRLTAAISVARSAEIPVHLYVPLCTPDGVAVLIGPGAGAVWISAVMFLMNDCPHEFRHIPLVGCRGAHLNGIGAAETVVVAQAGGS